MLTCMLYETHTETITQNSKEVFSCIAHVMYTGMGGHFQFQTFNRNLVYRWLLQNDVTMQGIWKLSNL